MPLRNSTRLVAGVGGLASVNVVLAPSTVPPGTSPSENCGPAPPQGPDVPSTITQSDGFPITPSRPPDELITAARPALNPGPLVGRKPRSPGNPTTSASCMGVWEGGWTGLAGETDARTSRILSGVSAAPTTQVSSNWIFPSLLYFTV